MRRRTRTASVVAIALFTGMAALATGQSLPAGAPAPEITNGAWINSEGLTIGALRGRVVLVEFWTYG